MFKTSCPICHKVMEGQTLADWPYFPFCSKRCKLIDLGRWLGEEYGIAAEEPDEFPADEGRDAP
jgi:endogenous inhibitor of DNA gyrase (YacG/DUF329 family)